MGLTELWLVYDAGTTKPLSHFDEHNVDNTILPILHLILLQYQFNITEGKGSPTIVGTLKATDEDTASFGQVSYYFAGEQTAFDIYAGTVSFKLLFFFYFVIYMYIWVKLCCPFGWY